MFTLHFLSQVLQRLTVWGMLGILTEHWFTGIKALSQGRWDAPTKSNLPIFFVYGIGGTLLELLDWSLSWNIFLKAVPMTFAIFAIEFLFGLLSLKVYGRCFWKYTKSDTSEETHRFSIMGLIRLDYALFWYVLAVGFMYIGPSIKHLINTISYL